MADPRIEKLADILVNYSIQVKKGDYIVVTANTVSAELNNAVVQKIIQAGGQAEIIHSSNLISATRMRCSKDEQLKWVSPVSKYIIENADGMITIESTANTRTHANVDPKKSQIKNRASAEVMQTFMQRMGTGELRWVGTQFPCSAMAQEADMSLPEFEDFVYSAMLADLPNPIGEWKKIENEQQKLVDWLEGKENVSIHSPNADLTLSIKGRTFENASGRVNMPDGEIYTSPVENSANGWIKFTYPAIYENREVEGVTLEFKDGKVVKATAEKNEDFLHATLDTDEGAKLLGEFAVGTNYGIKKFSKSILFDEKIGGSIHLALGNSLPGTGGLNESTIHWDMICDMQKDSKIVVDGEIFYQNGKFVV